MPSEAQFHVQQTFDNPHDGCIDHSGDTTLIVFLQRRTIRSVSNLRRTLAASSTAENR